LQRCDVFVISVSAAVLVLPSSQAAKSGTNPFLWDPCGTEDIKCTGQKNHVKIPYPENCRQYLLCIGGSRLRIKDCPLKQYFNNVSRECEETPHNCQSPCPGGAYARLMASSEENPSLTTLVADNVTASPATKSAVREIVAVSSTTDTR